WVHDDAIVLLGLLDRDVAVSHVVDDRVDRPLEWIGEAASGSGHDLNHLALRKPVARALAPHDLAAVRMHEADLVPRSVGAAVDPQGHCLVPPPGGGTEVLARSGTIGAHAAAAPTVPAPPRLRRCVERVLVDEHAVARLEHLDRNHVRLAVRDAHEALLAV